MKIVRVLDVPINSLTKKQVAVITKNFIASGLPNHIATVNPEFIVEAQDNNKFKKILKNTELNVADGVGIKFGAILSTSNNYNWQPAKAIMGFLKFALLLPIFTFFHPLFKNPIPEIITGVDLTYFFAGLAQKMGLKIYLVGGSKNIAKQAAINLQQMFPNLKIAGAEEGLPNHYLKEEDKKILIKQLIIRIREANPHILLVAFGAPKQEIFINENKTLLNVPVMMGVGGTLDFIAEKITRAPIFIRSIGFEWLWRLFQEPKRFKRIWRATVTFLWLIFKKQLF